jgi:serine/threonine protein kinase
MSGQSLFHPLYFSKIPLRDPTKLTIIALGLAYSLQYLHSKNLIHRNVKSLNVLLDSNDYPKLCDFGLTRNVPTDDSLMTSGIGTAHWSPPEILQREPYSQKADICSYGMVLYEFLERKTPFNGHNFVLIMQKIINEGFRPQIPQHGNQRIAPLIQSCWKGHPEERPSIDSIIKGFEEGNFAFPGTIADDVLNYSKLVYAHCQIYEPFDPSNISNDTFQMILKGLSNITSLSSCLIKLQSILDNPKWHSIITESNLMQIILQNLNDCLDSPIINQLISVFYSLLQIEKFRNTFLESKKYDVILSQFYQFVTTEMTNILDCLSFIIENCSVTFSNLYFPKFCGFLAGTNYEDRISATKLLIQIVKLKLYENDSDLNTIIHSVVENLIPNALIELLQSSIALLELLLPLPNPLEIILKTQIAQKLMDLLSHSNELIVSSSLKLLSLLISKFQTFNSVFIESFLVKFNSIIDQNNESHILFFLKNICRIFSSTNFYKVMSAKPSYFSSFSKCFQSSNSLILVLSLRILYSLLSHKDTFSNYSKHCQQLLDLHASHPIVTQLSASCLNIFPESTIWIRRYVFTFSFKSDNKQFKFASVS